MQLFHFSKEPLKEIYSKKQGIGKSLYDIANATHYNEWSLYPYKPNGLWFSAGDGEDGWRAWCESKEFNKTGLSVKQKIVLNDDANILIIDSLNKLYSFNNTFKIQGRFFEGTDWARQGIDWERVAKIYQGIVIAPYFWKAQLDSKTFWYYAWDCASGCIWDKEAIKQIKIIE